MSAHRARPVLKTVQLQWRLKEITPQTGKRIEIPVAQKQEGPKSPTHIVSGIKRTENWRSKTTIFSTVGGSERPGTGAGAERRSTTTIRCSCLLLLLLPVVTARSVVRAMEQDQSWLICESQDQG